MEWWHAALLFVAIISITNLFINIITRLKRPKAPLSQSEFNALPLPKQVAYMWANGKILGTRPDQNYTIIRYQLPTFYAEARYNPETDDILSIQTFAGNNDSETSIKNKLFFSVPAFV